MPSVKSHHVGDMVFETQVGDHKVLNDVPETLYWGGEGATRRRRTTSLHPCHLASRPSCSSTARDQGSMRLVCTSSSTTRRVPIRGT
jgi:hypothetical protein